MKNILVTGAAGFIGTNLIAKLLEKKYFVVGVDNLSSYYDPMIKEENLKSNRNKRFEFIEADITNRCLMSTRVFDKYRFDAVIHLAAQPGVSYSIVNSQETIDVNIKGFDLMLNLCAENKVKKFIFASSSSVLGDNDGVYRQKSPYAVTKAANELYGRMYADLYKDMDIIGLRFFTVYGPRMRPDLLISIATDAVLNDKKLRIFGDGTISREFTYVDDVVDNIIRVIEVNTTSKCSGRTFDVGIGNNKSVTINEVIEIIKEVCEKPNYNNIHYDEEKLYDAKTTSSCISPTFDYFGFNGLRCNTTLKEGIKKYVYYLLKTNKK